MKIIGILTMWGCEVWATAAIEHALRHCDEVLCVVNAHADNLKPFEDMTLEIAQSFGSKVRIVPFDLVHSHYGIKSRILNKCLTYSSNYEVGNWVMVLDVDEYYRDEYMEAVRKVMEMDASYNQIVVTSKCFFINMQHYYKSEHFRFFKITSKDDCFMPMQHWITKDTGLPVKLEGDINHYSLLLNPLMKIAQWKTEYPGKAQGDKVKWIEDIYRHYDLNNEEYWINENFKLFGHKVPLMRVDESAFDEGGKLFKYEGEHIPIITKSGLDKIKDFRTFYPGPWEEGINDI